MFVKGTNRRLVCFSEKLEVLSILKPSPAAAVVERWRAHLVPHVGDLRQHGMSLHYVQVMCAVIGANHTFDYADILVAINCF